MSRRENNLSEEHKEEYNSLLAIYDNELTSQGEEEDYFCIKIQTENEKIHFLFYFQFIIDYPSQSPPLVRIESSISLSKIQSELISSYLRETLFIKGEPSLYSFIEWIRSDCCNYLEEMNHPIIITDCPHNNINNNNNNNNLNNNINNNINNKNENNNDNNDNNFDIENKMEVEIYQGEAITEKKSTFQAFAANVSSIEEINYFIKTLKLNKKIAAATHNMIAYRFRSPHNKNHITAFRDDDGEGGAGENLLHLLDRLQLVNVVVMVSRWFGGIKLGSDRFRFITKSAQDLLVSQKLGEKLK